MESVERKMADRFQKNRDSVMLKKAENQIRVLVVEDHQISQKIAQLVLKGLTCEVDIAKNGTEALELFNLNTYNLIFMDIGLPDMNGLTLTTKIRSQEKILNLPPIPIVGLTAHKQMRLQIIEAGMNDFLLKPLTKENCLAVLNQFVLDKEVWPKELVQTAY